MQTPRGLRCNLGILALLTAVLILRTDAQARGVLRDAAIRAALAAISGGKLPLSDDRLVELIQEYVRRVVAAQADGHPSDGIEAAASLAQEAVSQVTAAYAAAIFQSTTAPEAQQLFARFQDTVDRIVQFAKSGDFGIRGIDRPADRGNERRFDY
ncbi:uncharacterized protein LOC124305676 [Neodiprion virginianus]|uniref:uncharacterized protein LOC124183832 n=1 Tax=Neodiprion fabricii TaxID=2872261 RepID=UPI001ED949FC|nr:uncharacterized protein LOC124183832 [Neodiprion fabricii]XP_046621273.1 uncharacterized protein LOC124305676 [Neodiprion virginianus]